MRNLKRTNAIIGILLGVIALFILFILGYYYWQMNDKLNGKQTDIGGRMVSVSAEQRMTLIMKDQLFKGIQEVNSSLHIGNKLSVVNQEELHGLDDILEDRLLIFHDEFDGDTLNPDYWTIAKGYIRNNEKQTYCESAIKLENGIAKITAKRDSSVDPNYEWVSGEFETRGKLAFQNCRMEARIRMDNELGFCPAFWTLGDSYNGWGWPRCGEIDIFETPNLNMVNCNTHFADKNNERKMWGTSCKENVDLTNWHIYAMEIIDGIITIYFDGEQIDWFDTNQFEYYDGVNPFTKAMFPIFNIAVGGNPSKGEPSANVDEVTMEIDWFRVYAKKEVTKEDVIPKSYTMQYLGNGKHFVDGKIKVGETVQLFPVYVPKNTVQSGIISCEVEDESICSCNAGYITALVKGNTTITVTDSYGLKDTIQIEVTE